MFRSSELRTFGGKIIGRPDASLIPRFELTKNILNFFKNIIFENNFKGQSLATDGTIVPTLDAPEFGYTRETTDSLFCPDIFYRQKDEYGNDVTKIGRPLPIEYLLTDVSPKN